MHVEELKKLVNDNPVHLSVRQAAKFMGMSEDGLRASMDQNRCPFGFSWKLGDRSGYKIPTLAFVAWLTKGAITFDQ